MTLRNTCTQGECNSMCLSGKNVHKQAALQLAELLRAVVAPQHHHKLKSIEYEWDTVLFVLLRQVRTFNYCLRLFFLYNDFHMYTYHINGMTNKMNID